jgi:sulfate transport system ATP-binding protein
MRIELRDVRKRFGDFEALRGVSLELRHGELVALLGPSGSGKTTLLRIIAGLELADEGHVRFDGQEISAAPVRQRGVGFVFQHYALFRHMTVFENVAFGLRVKPRAQRPPEATIRKKVRSLLALVQLEALEHRYPNQLSGGQRQRVALARALAIDPAVLLLDEPFGALDARVREELRQWLRRLHDEMEITSVLVTHDQGEALEVADRIVVMNEGRIEQVGSGADVYHRPATPFVCRFIGAVNVLGAWSHDGGQATSVLPEISAGGVAGSGVGSAAAAQPRALIYARPHEIDLARTPTGPRRVRASVVRVNPAGPLVRVDVVTGEGERIRIELPHERFAELDVKRGEEVWAVPRDVRAFDQGEGI